MIKGRRIPASLMLAQFAGGMAMADLREEYDLIEAEIHTALEYAAAQLEALDAIGMSRGEKEPHATNAQLGLLSVSHR